MLLTDLMKQLLNGAPFPDPDGAQRALATSLETLGYLLPGYLVTRLHAELPDSVQAALMLGRAASVRDASSDQAPGLPPTQVLEQLQEVCRVLARLLPGALVESMIRALPSELGSALAPRAQSSLATHTHTGEHTLASGRPGSSHPLSEAAPGSSHPVSSSPTARR
jgi:uncharacterized protein (DUF2267 family)